MRHENKKPKNRQAGAQAIFKERAPGTGSEISEERDVADRILRIPRAGLHDLLGLAQRMRNGKTAEAPVTFAEVELPHFDETGLWVAIKKLQKGTFS